MIKYEAPQWGEAEAVYDQHTLKILGKEVMEDWELPYMTKLGMVATMNAGKVLEVGYGMGISSKIIQSQEIESHTVIEAHPDVLTKCVADNRTALGQGRMHLVSGFWQDVTPMIGSETFDGILFDTYPIKQEEMIGPHMFFFEEAYRLLKPGGVLTYYSDESTNFKAAHLARLVVAGFKLPNIDFDLCDVTPPDNCEYWEESTMLVPIVNKSN